MTRFCHDLAETVSTKGFTGRHIAFGRPVPCTLFALASKAAKGHDFPFAASDAARSHHETLSTGDTRAQTNPGACSTCQPRCIGLDCRPAASGRPTADADQAHASAKGRCADRE